MQIIPVQTKAQVLSLLQEYQQDLHCFEVIVAVFSVRLCEIVRFTIAVGWVSFRQPSTLSPTALSKNSISVGTVTVGAIS